MWLLSAVALWKPSGVSIAWAIALRLIPIDSACRVVRSASSGEEPLTVMWRKFGPPAARRSTPGNALTWAYVAASGPTSRKSISLLFSAPACAAGSIARYVIDASFGFCPHQPGFGVMVYVCALVSAVLNLNGPAESIGLVAHPVLKVFGLLLVDAG